MVLPIAKLPAAILRRPTQDVVFPLSKDVRRLLLDMLDTVKKAKGIGLAAPQVSRDLNLALIYLEEAGLSPFFIINPKIVSASKIPSTIEEGCLSMPGVFGEVVRPKSVTVEFSDPEGARHSVSDDGWLARVMQHEIDHLNQTLIKDKLGKITQGAGILPEYEG